MLISVRMNVIQYENNVWCSSQIHLVCFVNSVGVKMCSGRKPKPKLYTYTGSHKDLRFWTKLKGNIHKASHRVLWLVLRPLGNLSEAILWSRKHQNHKVFIQYIMPKHSFTYYGKSGVYSIGILRFWPYNHNICYKSTIFTSSGVVLTN